MSQGAPTFFQAHFTATYNINQLQALATGICSIQILILVRSTLFEVPNLASQGTPGGVLRCPSRPTGHIGTFFRKSVLLKNVRLKGTGPR